MERCWPAPFTDSFLAGGQIGCVYRSQQPASVEAQYAAMVQKLQLSEAQVAQVIELQKTVLAKLEG